MYKQQSQRLIPHPMIAYRQSDIAKKSHQGFDQSAYKAWVECWETYVHPLENDISEADKELDELKLMLGGDAANIKALFSLAREIINSGSLVLSVRQVEMMTEILTRK